MTLARHFLHLRNKSGLSLRALAAKSRPRTDPTTFWKIEQGRPVKAATLGMALRALGLTESDDDYIRAFVLWSTEQAQSIPAASVSRGMTRTNQESKEFVALMRTATLLFRAMPRSTWPDALEALRHPEALSLWIKSRK